MYNAPKNCTNLDIFRYECFKKAVSRKKEGQLSKPVKLETLPPTSDAANQHFYRVYLQVQTWLSRELPVVEWGWSKKCASSYVTPVKMTLPAAPKKLLNIIFCSCEKGCSTQACTCAKAQILCSDVCKNCTMESCKNYPALYENEDILDDDEEKEEEEEESRNATENDYSDEENENENL